MQTRRILSTVALLLLTTSGADAQTAETVRAVERQLALKRLQGVWVPELLMTPQGAEAYPLSGRKLAFLEGNQFARFEGRRNVASGTFKVEDAFLSLTVEDRSPWNLEEADTKEKVQYVFRVEGDLLTLCYSVGDKAKDLTPGEGRLVVVYKRESTNNQAKGRTP